MSTICLPCDVAKNYIPKNYEVLYCAAYLLLDIVYDGEVIAKYYVIDEHRIFLYLVKEVSFGIALNTIETYSTDKYIIEEDPCWVDGGAGTNGPIFKLINVFTDGTETSYATVNPELTKVAFFDLGSDTPQFWRWSVEACLLPETIETTFGIDGAMIEYYRFATGPPLDCYPTPGRIIYWSYCCHNDWMAQVRYYASGGHPDYGVGPAIEGLVDGKHGHSEACILWCTACTNIGTMPTTDEIFDLITAHEGRIVDYPNWDPEIAHEKIVESYNNAGYDAWVVSTPTLVLKNYDYYRNLISYGYSIHQIIFYLLKD